MQVFGNASKSFILIIPGSQIPEWFSHQSDEASIKIRLPPNIQNDSQWIGVAFCCIFRTGWNYEHYASQSPELQCLCRIHGRDVDSRFYYVGEDTVQRRHAPSVISDHFWLIHWPRDMLYNSLSLQYESGECTNLEGQECEISAKYDGEHFEVKKCGIRILYKKDLEEIE